KTGNLKDELALLLRKRFELLPVGQIEFGQRRLRWQRSRVHHPGIGSEVSEAVEEAFTQFAPPEFVKIVIPEQGKKHFLFEHGLGGWGQPNGFCGGQLEDLSGV